MTKGTKIWLWCALVLSVLTTMMNGVSGRWISVVIAVAALAGLVVLLFTQKKWGFLPVSYTHLNPDPPWH